MTKLELPGGVLDYTLTDLSPPWAPAQETVVLHHGLGSCQGIWAEWVAALAARYRVVTFDMRGHGASSWPEAGARLDMALFTADVLALLDQLEVEQAHLVGESIGGTIMLRAALAAPGRALSLTVSNGAHVGATIQSVSGWEAMLRGGGTAAWSAHMMGQRFHPGALSAVQRQWYEDMQARCSPDVLIGGMRALVGADTRPLLGGLNMPVLLLHPDSSPFIPVALMADFRDRLTNARLHVIGDARHGLPFSHAQVCARLLVDFLAGQGRAKLAAKREETAP